MGSSTSNGCISMISSSLELMSLVTPCKLRKHSWYGACSSVSSSTSPGPISFALLQPMLPARTENKSQSTGLVELATWSQKWTWAVKAIRLLKKSLRTSLLKSLLKRLKKPRPSEHLDDLHDQSIHNFLRNYKFKKELCIDIFRIYFRSPLLE